MRVAVGLLIVIVLASAPTWAQKGGAADAHGKGSGHEKGGAAAAPTDQELYVHLSGG